MSAGERFRSKTSTHNWQRLRAKRSKYTHSLTSVRCFFIWDSLYDESTSAPLAAFKIPWMPSKSYWKRCSEWLIVAIASRRLNMICILLDGSVKCSHSCIRSVPDFNDCICDAMWPSVPVVDLYVEENFSSLCCVAVTETRSPAGSIAVELSWRWRSKGAFTLQTPFNHWLDTPDPKLCCQATKDQYLNNDHCTICLEAAAYECLREYMLFVWWRARFSPATTRAVSGGRSVRHGFSRVSCRGFILRSATVSSHFWHLAIILIKLKCMCNWTSINDGFQGAMLQNGEWDLTKFIIAMCNWFCRGK